MDTIIKWKISIDDSISYEMRSKDLDLGGDILDALEDIDNFLSTKFSSLPIAKECESKLRSNETFVIEENSYKVSISLDQ